MSDQADQTTEATEDAAEFGTLLSPDQRGQFSWEQVQQLLRPVNPKRVQSDGKNKAYLAQQDVTAHLIRLFGYGGFDTHVVSLDLVYEEEAGPKADGTKRPGRYNVCYRAVVRLTVRDPEGRTVAEYENGSTGEGPALSRSDAHDLAMKSAISTAMKRCAINLGDQFGLSLYNKGQLKPIVMATMVVPEAPAVAEDKDVQKDVGPVRGDGDDTADEQSIAEQDQPGENSQEVPPLPADWMTMVRRAERFGEEQTLVDLANMATAHDNHEARARIIGALTRVRRQGE